MGLVTPIIFSGWVWLLYSISSYEDWIMSGKIPVATFLLNSMCKNLRSLTWYWPLFAPLYGVSFSAVYIAMARCHLFRWKLPLIYWLLPEIHRNGDRDNSLGSVLRVKYLSKTSQDGQHLSSTKLNQSCFRNNSLNLQVPNCWQHDNTPLYNGVQNTCCIVAILAIRRGTCAVETRNVRGREKKRAR
jgi:hypothetical protein